MNLENFFVKAIVYCMYFVMNLHIIIIEKNTLKCIVTNIYSNKIKVH